MLHCSILIELNSLLRLFAFLNTIFILITIDQFAQAIVSLYRVYCWKIIQQRMLVVDNFHVKIRYTYTHFFSYVFESCIGFMLSNCVNE